MRYNVMRMSLSELEAYQRLQQAARSTASSLAVDRGSVHWRDEPYLGVEFSLALGEARALLFMPARDIAEPGWEQRLPGHLESAHRYLVGFTRPAR